ncbi:MAG: hypothetical protein IKW10_02110 [Oscillospiraceae bacterium]|nr:hypothetical protein [Oscillospiraceae bacterium]
MLFKKISAKFSLATVLAALLIVSMLPMAVFAEETAYVASVGDQQYATVAAAVANANGETVTLLADSQEQISVSGDLQLDLNGYSLAELTVTDGVLYGKDASTDDYDCADGYGKILNFIGEYVSEEGYVAVNEEGVVSFHRYDLAITHQSLSTGNKGVGYKAVFYGDAKVVAQLDTEEAFGFSLQLDQFSPVERWKGASDFQSGKPLTLRVNNYDAENYGEAPLYATVQIKLYDGTVLESESYSSNLRQMVEAVNAEIGNYSQAQIKALGSWIVTSEAMQSWTVNSILYPAIVFDMNVAGNDLVVESGAFTGELESVTLGGLTLADATLVDGKLTVPAASFQISTMPSGALTLEVKTSEKTHTLSGDFTWVINNDTELWAMKSHLVADGTNYTGSLALGADITQEIAMGYNNGIFTTSEYFAGTFDGRGYAVHSLSAASSNKGLFTNVSGKICNLRVLNATVKSSTAPLVGMILTGQMENIYVKGSITSNGTIADDKLNNFGCGLLAARYRDSAKVKNVIVEVVSIADGLNLATAFGKIGNYNAMNWTSFTNCYAINANGQVYMTYATTPEKVTFAADSGNGQFATMDELWADADAAALAVQLGLEKPSAQITLDTPYDMNVAGNDLKLQIAAAPESITISGTDIALTGTWENGVLTIPAEAFMLDTMPTGTMTLEIATAACDYEITGEFIWVINTKEELYAMKTHLTVAEDGKTYNGSLALGADINPGSGYLNVSNTVKFFESADIFAGTFDGRSHTLYKVFTQAARNGLFPNVSGTIKNLKMENCYVKNCAGALVGQILTGTVENVYIYGTIQDDDLTAGGDWTYQGCGLLAGQIKKGASIKNSIVNVKAINEAALEVGTAFGKLNTNGMTEAVFENCYAINASGAAYMIINGKAGDKYDFALSANGNYASLADLWLDEDSAARKLAEETFLLPAPERASISIAIENSYDMNVADQNFVLENKSLKGSLQSVTLAGIPMENASLEDGVLTIPAASFQKETMPSGALTMQIATTAMDCTVTGEFIWVINTKDELYAMKTHLTVAEDGKTYTGSLALGADIDPESGYLSVSNSIKFFESADIFAGTFDGRSHTLYKVFTQASKNGLFPNVSGTIKNLKIDKSYVKGATALLVGNVLTGTVENVYIYGTIQDDGLTAGNWTYQGCGLLAGQIKKGAAVRNCIVNVAEIKAAAAEVGTAFGKVNEKGMTESVFENCYAVNASGNAYMMINGTAGDKSDFALDVNGNFANMADLWADADAAALAEALGLTK